MKHAGLELVGVKTMFGLERAGMLEQLIDGADLAPAAAAVGITEEQIGGEADPVAYAPAKQLVNRHAELLADDVETGEFQRCVELRGCCRATPSDCRWRSACG